MRKSYDFSNATRNPYVKVKRARRRPMFPRDEAVAREAADRRRAKRLRRELSDAQSPKLLDVLYGLIDRKRYRAGIGSLNDAQRVFLIAFHTLGIVGNGGFHYFFEQTIGPERAEQAFRSLRMDRAADAIRRAASVFPRSRPHYDFWDRMDYLDRRMDRVNAVFEAANDMFWEATKSFNHHAMQFARKHRDGLLEV